MRELGRPSAVSVVRRVVWGLLGLAMFAGALAIAPVAGAGRTTTSTTTTSTSTTSTSTTTTLPAAWVGKRIDLRVLVLDDGGPGTVAVMTAMDAGLVPYTRVDLADPGRPVISSAFLADTVDGVRRSRFQAVVTANDAPAQLSAEELASLSSVEVEFGLRRVNAYMYPSPSVGLNSPAAPAYVGALDGMNATVTAAARASGWSDLRGSVPFDDNDPTVLESYGYLTTPVTPAAAGTSFQPMVTIPIPGTTTAAPVVGVFRSPGREQLVITASMNGYQRQLLALGEGIVNWMTRGVHLGLKRNYFMVHADDVFMADDRWSVTANCTPGEDCPSGVTTTPIRMSVTDAQFLRSWQTTNNFKIDLVFNGFGNVTAVAGGGDKMGAELIKNRSSFRWINHTYSHEYLGCVKNYSVIPWQCTRNADGSPVWVSGATITQQVADNISWARTNRIPFDPTELVTGEHSGLRRAPEEPSDNPAIAQALTGLGITSLASDHSREPQQRRIGQAGPLTLPRYPLNIFYNVAKKTEQVDEYNWIYNSRAAGGSGICEVDVRSTCIAPLNTTTGFDSYIRPLEARLALLRVLNGLPHAHYAHQSNLAEERILYPVVENVLAGYRALFADTAPLQNPSQGEATRTLRQMDLWRQAVAAGSVEAYLQGGIVHVKATGATSVPLTVPEGASVSGQAFATAYGGRRSGWVQMSAGQYLQVTVPTLGS